MKISKISIKNCLGIEEVTFAPSDLTLIEGKSGTGKTSIIDSITQFLLNKGERPDFVHDGAKKGEVFIEFDNGLKGKKTFKPNGKCSSVSLEKDGMQPKGAETFLKGLFNPYQINPIDFIFKTPKEQTETILNSVPMELTEEQIIEYFGENLVGDTTCVHALVAASNLEKAYFEKRKESNSTVKYLKSDIEVTDNKIPVKYNVEEWRNINLFDIVNEINEINQSNKSIDACSKFINNSRLKKESLKIKAKSSKESLKVNAESNKEILRNKIEQLEQEIANADSELKKNISKVDSGLEEALSDIDGKTANSAEYLENNKERSTDSLQEKLKESEKMKSFIGLADDLEKKKKGLEEEELLNADLSSKLEIARALPQELIKTAKFPVEGMNIDDKGLITINGRSIKNLSGAERIDFAVEIAKLTCGELHTILINGFESLDSEKKQEFIEKANQDTDYQYIIADVTDSDLVIK